MGADKKEGRVATVGFRFHKMVQPVDYEGIKVELSVTQTCADNPDAVNALCDGLSDFVQQKVEKAMRIAVKRHRIAKKKGVY